MLRVTVELVPGGAASFRRTIGSMTIANVSELADVSDYAIRITEDANPLTGAAPKSFRFILQGHSRRQSAWALVKRAITEMEANEPTKF